MSHKKKYIILSAIISSCLFSTGGYADYSNVHHGMPSRGNQCYADGQSGYDGYGPAQGPNYGPQGPGYGPAQGPQGYGPQGPGYGPTRGPAQGPQGYGPQGPGYGPAEAPSCRYCQGKNARDGRAPADRPWGAEAPRQEGQKTWWGGEAPRQDQRNWMDGAQRDMQQMRDQAPRADHPNWREQNASRGSSGQVWGGELDQNASMNPSYLDSQGKYGQKWSDDSSRDMSSYSQGSYDGTGKDFSNGKKLKTDSYEKVKGTVKSVNRVQYPDGTQIQVMLETDNGVVKVILGPASYIDTLKIKLISGDKVTVKGYLVTGNGEHTIMASEINKNGNLINLRDETRRPVWNETTPKGNPSMHGH